MAMTNSEIQICMSHVISEARNMQQFANLANDMLKLTYYTGVQALIDAALTNANDSIDTAISIVRGLDQYNATDNVAISTGPIVAAMKRVNQPIDYLMRIRQCNTRLIELWTTLQAGVTGSNNTLATAKITALTMAVTNIKTFLNQPGA